MLASLMVLLVVATGLAPVAAQQAPTPITVGQPQTGAITAQNIAPGFLFSVTDTQAVQVVVDSATAGFVPALRVLNAAGELVEEIANPGGLSRLQTVLLLQGPGAYVLQVSSANGFTGQFTIGLDQAAAPLALPLNQAINENVTLENPVDRFLIESSPTDTLELLITTAAPLNTVVTLTGDDGMQLLQASLRLTTLRMAIPPQLGQLILSVQFGGGQVEAYQLILRSAQALPLATPTLVPTPIPPTPVPPTPVPQPTQVPLLPLPATGPCLVASGSGTRINLRSGPGLQFNVVAQLSGNLVADVTGRLPDNSWFQVTTRTTQPISAWVSSSVVRFGGQCGAVPVVAGPGQIPTATPIFIPPPGNLPDLIVTGISFNPGTPAEDQAFTTNVTIANVGSVQANNVLIRVTFDPDGDVDVNTGTAEASVASIAPGTSITVNFNGIVADDDGTIDVTAVVDPNNSIPESNDGNNSQTVEVRIGGGLADLTVTDVTVTGDDNGDTTVTVTFTIRNQGSGDARNFETLLTFEPGGVRRTVGWEEIGAGDSETRSIDVDLGANGNYDVTVNADWRGLVAESNEGNNQAQDNFTING